MSVGSALAPDLALRFKQKRALIGVIGLGYVGLPLCLALAESGSRVLGFDIDAGKAETIARGASYIKHIADEKIAELAAAGRLEATVDFSLLSKPDALLICVPTPLTRHLEPDLSFVISTGQQIARHLRRGQLVVLEATTYPGTTEQVLRPILEESGLKAGRDFFLAYSPEREDPGNTDFSAARFPKVVGGDSQEARDLAVALYGSVAASTVPVSSAATAEAVKLTENIFRAVNIALVNELKIVYKAMGIDIWEVIEAAKTKPFGFMPFYPGPGLGGHCLPIDPYYLTWKAREYGIATHFIELAGQINTSMPGFVVNELAMALDRRAHKGLNGARILVVGVAYKRNVDDTRESPALRLMELLEARGAAVDYYDPYVPAIPETRKHRTLTGRKSLVWDLEQFAVYDAVLIATDHDSVDHAALARGCKMIVDTRNACARAGIFSDHIVRA